MGTLNENLVELRANFANVSRRFLLKLPRFIPNLNKLVIEQNFIVNLDVLKMFRKLEHVEVKVSWERYTYHSNPSLNRRGISSNVKILNIARAGWPLTPANSMKLVADFPNLESLSVARPVGLTDESVEILLKELKHLKQFHVYRNENILSERTVISLKNYGQKLEEFHIWNIKCQLDFCNSELENFTNLLMQEKDQGIWIGKV
jgi:hypothetical protein